jgi:N-acetylglucosaminyl-diphospho-decaprenol L-rhamnosyltransferase
VRVGLATIQHGRREHLVRQARAVLDQSLVPDRYVVLSMDPSPHEGERALDDALGPSGAAVELVASPAADGAGRLPLAAARNLAIRALGDVDLAILLDVDCIPDRALVERYVAAHAVDPTARRLLAGPVAYLPPGRPRGLRLGSADRDRA